MKILFLIWMLLTSSICFSQDKEKIDSAYDFIKKNNISLNSVKAPIGFNIYYNCDSMLFMRGDFGDTIKIWTPGSEMPQELNLFKETIHNEHFGITQFAREVQADGRILVISHWQTQFISRNDSLYEIINSNPLPQEDYTKVLSELFKSDSDGEAFKVKWDSIHNKSEAQAIYIPKLIFSSKMFSKGKTKVKLPKRINYEEDTIVLEKRWQENQKECYLIRIKNKTDKGEQTSYAYAIDQDMKFIWWQGCNTK